MKLRIHLYYDPLINYNKNNYVFEYYIADICNFEKIICDKIILNKLKKVFVDNKKSSTFFIDINKEEEVFYLALKHGDNFEKFIKLCQI